MKKSICHDSWCIVFDYCDTRTWFSLRAVDKSLEQVSKVSIGKTPPIYLIHELIKRDKMDLLEQVIGKIKLTTFLKRELVSHAIYYSSIKTLQYFARNYPLSCPLSFAEVNIKPRPRKHSIECLEFIIQNGIVLPQTMENEFLDHESIVRFILLDKQTNSEVKLSMFQKAVGVHPHSVNWFIEYGIKEIIDERMKSYGYDTADKRLDEIRMFESCMSFCNPLVLDLVEPILEKYKLNKLPSISKFWNLRMKIQQDQIFELCDFQKEFEEFADFVCYTRKMWLQEYTFILFGDSLLNNKLHITNTLFLAFSDLLHPQNTYSTNIKSLCFYDVLDQKIIDFFQVNKAANKIFNPNKFLEIGKWQMLCTEKFFKYCMSHENFNPNDFHNGHVNHLEICMKHEKFDIVEAVKENWNIWHFVQWNYITQTRKETNEPLDLFFNAVRTKFPTINFYDRDLFHVAMYFETPEMGLKSVMENVTQIMPFDLLVDLDCFKVPLKFCNKHNLKFLLETWNFTETYRQDLLRMMLYCLIRECYKVFDQSVFASLDSINLLYTNSKKLGYSLKFTVPKFGDSVDEKYPCPMLCDIKEFLSFVDPKQHIKWCQFFVEMVLISQKPSTDEDIRILKYLFQFFEASGRSFKSIRWITICFHSFTYERFDFLMQHKTFCHYLEKQNYCILGNDPIFGFELKTSAVEYITENPVFMLHCQYLIDKGIKRLKSDTDFLK